MGRVIAYHPSILVRKSDTVYRLDITCDDWYQDDQIIRTLAAITGAATFGGIVDMVCREQVMGGIIIDAHCSVSADVGDHDTIYDYFQLIG